MRVTQYLLFRSSFRELDQNSEKLLKLQKQASSGKRVIVPSDDPISAQRIMDLKGSLRRIDPGLRTGQYVQSWLSITESSIDKMEEALVRAKEIALSQSSSTASSETRSNAAKEVKEIYDQIVQLANTKLGDRYIFGGTKTDTAPVVRDDLYNPTFSGNDQTIEVRVYGGQKIAMNITAQELVSAPNTLGVLKNLISGLENNDSQLISSQITGLDQANVALNSGLAETGGRGKTVENHITALKDTQTNLQETLSEYEDADTALVYTELTNQQTVYEAALRATATVIRTSLMDFLD